MKIDMKYLVIILAFIAWGCKPMQIENLISLSDVNDGIKGPAKVRVTKCANVDDKLYLKGVIDGETIVIVSGMTVDEKGLDFITSQNPENDSIAENYFYSLDYYHNNRILLNKDYLFVLEKVCPHENLNNVFKLLDIPIDCNQPSLYMATNLWHKNTIYNINILSFRKYKSDEK